MAPSADDRNDDRNRSKEREGDDYGKRLDALGDRLDAAKGRRPDPGENERRGNAIGMSFRIATDLIAGVLVGGLVGWQLDAWLGTRPVLLLIFLVLGTAAGLLNVIRTARSMQPGATDGEQGSKRTGSDPGSD